MSKYFSVLDRARRVGRTVYIGRETDGEHEHSAAAETCQDVLSEIQTAVIGDQQRFETILTAIVGGGHVLLEDVPGTGRP